MDVRQEVRSLGKGLRVLALLNRRGEGSVTEVAGALALPRTTAHRLLETLRVEGYLARETDGDRYRPTSRVGELASGYRDQHRLADAARPVIAALARALHWPLMMTTPERDQMEVRVSTEYETTLAIARHAVGQRMPMLHTTTGLCWLAFCHEAEREAALELARASGDPLQALAHRPAELARMLDQIRRDGHRITEHADYREGSLGLPLIVDGQARGGLVMRYIKRALRPAALVADFLPRLQQAAAEIAGA